MKKLFPLILMVLGVAFLAGGVYAGVRGVDARNQVRSELEAQRITTPEDASIPNAPVVDVATARSMAEIIDHHATDSTGGLTYSEMGRFMTEDGDPAGTDDPEAAVVGADGKPVNNPVRNVAFQASALRTSLYSSIMAFEVANLVVGIGALLAALGVAVGGTGVALAGLAIPTFSRRLHVPAVAAEG